MKMLLSTVAVVLFALQSVYSQCLSENDSEIPKDAAHKSLYGGQQTFTLNVFDAVNKAQPKENIFFSPYSIYQSLLLAYFSSSNYTESSIKEALKLNPDESKISIMKSYKIEEFLRKSQPSVSYEFNSANRVYVDSDLPVRECMLEFFEDEMEKLELRKNSIASREYINAWVMNQTKNNIKDLIPPDGIDSSTKLVLVNAAYFKGVWASRFDENKTEKEVFYMAPDKQTFVDMMKQTGKFNYGTSEELGAHILEMPYKGENVSMFVLLPPFAVQEEGIEKILTNLTPATLAKIVEEGALLTRQVEVAFPKFTIEKNLPLKYVFDIMGLNELFSDDADFSFLTGEVGPHFSEASHKAKIRIDERGTVAAAATAVFSFRSSRPIEQLKFICDHPFVYFLYDRPSSTITFMGVFRDPKNLS